MSMRINLRFMDQSHGAPKQPREMTLCSPVGFSVDTIVQALSIGGLRPVTPEGHFAGDIVENGSLPNTGDYLLVGRYNPRGMYEKVQRLANWLFDANW